MGRAENRRKQRADRLYFNKMSIKVTPDELQRMSERTSRDAGRYDTEVLLTAFALTLHDKFGFGFSRVEKALSGVDEMLGKVLSDEINIEDMKERLKNEVGINITA